MKLVLRFQYHRGYALKPFYFLFQTWHEKIDVKSAVLPKIIKLLGSESHLLSGIYPRILPLVHEIPQEALEDFYGDILDAIKSGLKTFVITSTQRNIAKASTQSGGSACVMAYFEVALHCLKNSNEAKHSQIFDKVSDARHHAADALFMCVKSEQP